MKHGLRSRRCLYSWLIGFIMCLFCGFLAFVSLANNERDSITLVIDDNYPPYVFRDEQGRLVGELVDEWRLWEEKTGIKVTIIGMDWADCLKAMAEGRADVIDTAFRTQSREAFMDFLPPHKPIPVAIYARKDTSTINKIDDLHGFVVGVKKGDACVEWLQGHGIKDIALYPSYEDLIDAAVAKQVKVFCMDEPPANFLIHRKKAEDNFNYALYLYSGEFHRAVKKGDKELFEMVKRGFEAITPQEYDQIKRRWDGKSIPKPLDPRLIIAMWLGVGAVAVLLLIVVVLRYLVVRKTRELTEIKNHLEATLNALPDLLFEVDLSGRFHDLHSAISEEFLLMPKKDFMGKTMVEVLPRDVAEAGMNGITQALKHGKAIVEYQLEIRGELRWFEFTVVPKKMIDESQPHFIFLCRDITDQKRATAQVIATQRQLLQAQKLEAIGRLAGGIAHDLNNFLMPILGYAEMGLQLLNPDEKLYLYLNEIKKGAERAANIIKQILIFSKKLDLGKEKIDINAVITELKNSLFYLLGENIQIYLRVAPNLFKIMADKGQMEQVIMNLVINARDAMPNGGKITIETLNKEEQSQDGIQRNVVIRVSDTGCGMSKALQERIFDPFFTTKGADSGTGLGLSTVYGIIKQHGGEITVESEVGHGSTFTISLPALEEDIKPQPLEISQKGQVATQSHTEEGLNIIVVDDDEHIVSLVSMILQAHGHQVVSFNDPLECLNTIRQKRPVIDILLTDIVMPGISGIELWKELKNIYPELKAILMSGYELEDNNMAILKEQHLTMLQKPFGITSLIDAITRLKDVSKNQNS